MGLERVLSPSPVVFTHPLNIGRVAWWLALPNRSGGGVWRDLVGNLAGTLTNVDTTSGFRPTTRPGGFAHVLFDGTNDYVDTPASVIGSLSNKVATVAAWIYPTGSLTAYQCVWDASPNGLQTTRQLSAFLGGAANHLYVAFANTAGNEITISQSFVLNTWQRLMVVSDGTVVSIYINGVSVYSATNAAAIGTGFVSCDIQFGGNPSTHGAPYKGNQDDMSVWSRALSPADAKSDYDLSRLGYPGVLQQPPAFLRRYFSLAGGGGPVSLALTGQSLTAAQGSLSPASALTLSGQALVAAQGSLVAALTQSLTGQAATAAQGSLSPASALALSGQSSTVGQGSISPGLSQALAGQSASAGQGSLSLSMSQALTGQSLTAARGSLTPSLSLALSGQALTVGQGSVTTPGSVVIALTGLSLTASQGALSPGVAAALTGQSSAFAIGSLTSALTTALTGQGLAVAQGSVTGPSNGAGIQPVRVTLGGGGDGVTYRGRIR